LQTNNAASGVSSIIFRYGTNGSYVEQARITSGGNLLVGTTSNPDSSRMVVSGGSITHASTQLNTRPGTATQYEFVNRNGAGFDFYVNNASNLAARIDASGNVGIGTSAPGVRLEIAQNQAAYSYFDYYNTTNAGGIVWRQIVRNLANSGNTSVDFAKLISSGFAINNNDTGAANFTAFGVGASERMRIDSSGNLLVGTTTANAKLSVVSSAFNTLFLDAQGAASNALFEKNNTAGGYCVFNFSGSGVGSITTNGTTTSYNITSDARLKHDIVDAPEASSLIDAMQVRSFKWNFDDSEQRYGFVAQELVEIAPEAVSVPADEDQMMGVDYSKLVPMLVKEIQSLRARVAQLEGN
jgi:hypothetical protein